MSLALYSVSKHYWNIDSDSTLYYADSALIVATNSHFTKGIALALLSKGVALSSKGEYLKALEQHLQVLKISEQENMPGLTANCYTNIGNVYVSLGEFQKALDYHTRALDLIRTVDKTADLSAFLINLGDTHLKLNHYAESIRYNTEALTMAKETKDTLTIAITLFNLGEASQRLQKFDQAWNYFVKSGAISKTIDDREGILLCVSSLSRVLFSQQHYSESIVMADSALTLAQKMKMREVMVESYNTLYNDFLALRDPWKALEYRNKEIQMRDSLVNVLEKTGIENLQAVYELEKKETQLGIQQHQIRTAYRWQLTMAISLAVVLVMFAYLVWLGTRGRKLNILLIERNLFINNLILEIKNKNNELTKLNVFKDKLMSIISHDIRSPLNHLKALTELVQTENISASEFQDIIKKINQHLTVTNIFVENLLFWAKSQIEGEQIRSQAFDVAAITSHVLSLLKPTAEAKGIRIVNSIDNELNGYADPSMIEIVVRNLLTNAIKFSEIGGVVEVMADHNDDFITLMVLDHGVGMSPEKVKKLFNTTVESSVGTDNERGIGLGLLLCKELVEKNGGEIKVTSNPGKGSEFTFTIPTKNV